MTSSISTISSQRGPTVVTPTGLKITPVPGSAVAGRAAAIAAVAQQSLSAGGAHSGHTIIRSSCPPIAPKQVILYFLYC